MTNTSLDIDHVIIGVGNLESAAHIYRGIGFTLSPRGVHSASMGTANHTVMLQRDYFELLTILAPTERNVQWRTALAEGDGGMAIALRTHETNATREAWRRADLDSSEIVAFSRPVSRPGGKSLDARFETLHLPTDTLPGVGVFACRHFTPKAVWLPELVEHANSATAIAAVAIEAGDPQAAAAAWTRVLGGVRAEPAAGGLRLKLATHVIDILAAPRLGATQRVTGLTFRVADRARCIAALTKGGVLHRPEGSILSIAPEQACGVKVSFEA
jgi:catechol 2,3-dioxygenase-like lactoylglutathione lyase family enzyme